MARRLVVRGAAVALATLLLSGCWLQVGFDAGHTRSNTFEEELTAANVATLTAAWSAELRQEASEPMVRGDRVYLATGGAVEDPQVGTVFTVDARAFGTVTGAPAWTRNLFTFNYCCGGPTTPDGLFTPATFVGDELWTGYVLLVGPRPSGGFAAPVRLDPADGTILGQESVVAVSAAVPVDDVVVQTWLDVGAARSLVVRDRATRVERWRGSLPPTFDLSPGTPAVADGQVLVAEGTRVAAFPLAGCGAPTCDATWSLDLGETLGDVAMAPGGDLAFVVAGEHLVAVDRATGTEAWRAALGAPATTPAIADGTVLVTAGSVLRAFPAAGCGASICGSSWMALLPAAATASPAVAGGVVYTGSSGGVTGFPAAGCGGPTCGPLVQLPTEGDVDHLSVAGGRLFAVSRSTATGLSRLTAYTPDPG
jgi:outer membrane protein assembly factor BamB